MDETTFLTLANTELETLETCIEDATGACNIDCDIEMQAGGILQLEFENGSKIIINRHIAAQEIWIAARSGGFHFRYVDGQWLGTRDGRELHDALSELISQQTDADIKLG